MKIYKALLILRKEETNVKFILLFTNFLNFKTIQCIDIYINDKSNISIVILMLQV